MADQPFASLARSEMSGPLQDGYRLLVRVQSLAHGGPELAGYLTPIPAGTHLPARYHKPGRTLQVIAEDEFPCSPDLPGFFMEGGTLL